MTFKLFPLNRACRTYDFYLNLSEQDVILSGLSGMDLVTGETIDGAVTIPGRGNLIVKTV